MDQTTRSRTASLLLAVACLASAGGCSKSVAAKMAGTYGKEAQGETLILTSDKIIYNQGPQYLRCDYKVTASQGDAVTIAATGADAPGPPMIVTVGEKALDVQAPAPFGGHWVRDPSVSH